MQISFIYPKNFTLNSFKSPKKISTVVSSALKIFNRSFHTSNVKPLDPSKIEIEKNMQAITHSFNIAVEGKDIQEAFLNSVKNENVAAVKLMLKAGIVDVTCRTGTKALDLAIDSSSEITDLLLMSGAKVNYLMQGNFTIKPLWTRACLNGSVLLVKELLQNKLMSVDDSDYEHYTPILLASKRVNTQLVELFLNHKAKATPNLVYCMYQIDRYSVPRDDRQNLSFVSKLLDYGLDPNGKLSDGYSLLHLAIDNNDPGVILKFLEKGANINVECHGISPLYYALGECRYKSDIVNLLLKQDIKPKKLTPIEVDAVTEYRQNLEENNIKSDHTLNMLMEHNPEVKTLINYLAEKDKDEKIQQIVIKCEELTAEVGKLKLNKIWE